MSEVDEVYCYKWYKDMYLNEGFLEKDASTKAKIDLDYQISLMKMCELFKAE
jgi:hypothetical protein